MKRLTWLFWTEKLVSKAWEVLICIKTQFFKATERPISAAIEQSLYSWLYNIPNQMNLDEFEAELG